MEPRISVIVPIYQVEAYLADCIESILKQSYKNLEILLINDGSKDRCPLICKKYAKKDSRIKVINKENGGISSARNIGIEVATGEFLTFVDSDDTIDEHMIAILYENMIAHKDCNISVCFFEEVYENNRAKKSQNPSIKSDRKQKMATQTIEYLDKVEAMKKMLYQRGTDSCPWGKLYAAELFDTIRFPHGQIYEDIAIMYQVFDLADHVVFTDYKGYLYLQRNNSIIREKFALNKMSLIDFVAENEKFLIHKYPRLRKAAVSRTVRANFHIYLQIPGTKEYKAERERIEKNIKARRKIVMQDEEAAGGTKAALMLTYFGFSLLRTLKSLKNWGKAT